MATSKHFIEISLNAVNKASWQLSKVSKDLGNFAEKNEENFRNLRNTAGVAFWVISTWIWLSIREASDLEESINAVNVVFWDWASVIEEFGKVSARQAGIATSSFNQMATQTWALLKDVWLPMEEVAWLTVDLTKRAADMASVFNTSVDDALSAINQALRWETEAIRRYTWDVTDATLQQYLMSQWINTAVSSMTEQEKRLLRLDVIMSQTAVTQWDFQNTSGSLANQQRILTEEIKNIAATLWTQFLPIVNEVVKRVAVVIQKVGDWIQENPELAKNIGIAAVAITWIATVVWVLWTAIWPVIIAVKWLSAALVFLAANPIWATIVAITALVAAWVYLMNNQEEVKQVLTSVWNSISDAVIWFINWIIDKVNVAIDVFNSLWSVVWIQIWNIDRLSDSADRAIQRQQQALTQATESWWSSFALEYTRNLAWRRASWWSVTQNQPYLVWERWPEIFVPNSSWSIQPNWGGMWWITINMSWTVIREEADIEKLATEIAREINNWRKWQ